MEDIRIIEAHKFCSNHKKALLNDQKCGCFFCLKIFDPKEITDWIEDTEGVNGGFPIAKKIGLDYKSAAIAGLLHDFYYKPWQENHEKVPFFKMHGFVHAHEALENSRKNFPELMNPVVENCIERHMFPLNIVPPKYREGFIITCVDKWNSVRELPSIKVVSGKVKNKFLGVITRKN